MSINQFPCNATLYNSTPMPRKQVEELEEIVKDRLKLYEIFENADTTIELNKWSTEYSQYIESEIQKANLSSYILLLTDYTDNEEVLKARENDLISHCILRLAYGQIRLEWCFFKKEFDWFRICFQKMPPTMLDRFISYYKFNFQIVGDQEKSLFGLNENQIFYKCRFEHCSNIVKNVQCFLRFGTAYFNESDLVDFYLDQLEDHLSQCVKIEQKIINNPECQTINFDILLNLIDNLTLVQPLHKDVLIPLTLDNYHNQTMYFPPCMEAMHKALMQTHHLKFFGRRQYALFLKDIGMSLDDALQFWETEFLKGMTSTMYKRNRFKYYFKHLYGVVGSRSNYRSFDCDKIQEDTTTPGQNYGCPFKYMTRQKLHRQLLHLENGSKNVEEIITLVDRRQYKLACSKYLKCCHKNIEPTNTIQSPVQYYANSLKVKTMCSMNADIEDIFKNDEFMSEN